MSDKSIALISGASRGIGRAIAQQLGEQGYTVVGTATSPAGAAAITDYLADAGVGGAGMVLDVTDADNVAAVVADVASQFGPIAALVNNAGITRDNLMMRMSEAEWLGVFDANLHGAYRLIRQCLKAMLKARQGRIVNIGSVVGSMGNAGQANYAATKAGLAGMTRALAREIGGRGITVNCVAPGFIDTDMTESLPAAQREALLANVALGRLGTPAEVAAVVGFLCGPGGAYITGETLHVNGGLYMA